MERKSQTVNFGKNTQIKMTQSYTFSLPSLHKKRKKETIKQLGDLSFKAEEIQSENYTLRNQYSDIINSPDSNNFCKYKKWQIEFQTKLNRRDKELDKICKDILSFRTRSVPTTMDISITMPKKVQIDELTYSLMLSNQQRGFFPTDDIKEQNSEFKKIIEQQEEELNILNTKINLFRHSYHKGSARRTVNALKSGILPDMITPDQMPSEKKEIDAEKRVVKEKLQSIINERNRAKRKIIKQKLEKREQRRKNRSAVVIQKNWRGFSVRNKLRNQ